MILEGMRKRSNATIRRLRSTHEMIKPGTTKESLCMFLEGVRRRSNAMIERLRSTQDMQKPGTPKASL
jgi:hypothetical protein